MKRKLFVIITCTLLVSVSLPSLMAVPSSNTRWGPPYGPTEGFVGEELAYCIKIPDDPMWDEYYAMWDWGDGNFSDWLGPYNGGNVTCASHIWNAPGDYNIKVKLKNIHGAESDWSEALMIRIYQGPVFEIGKITGGFWKIGAEITNSGDYNATNVNWEIYIHGGTITPIYFGGGTIPILKSGKTEYVSHFGPLFGFGKFDIIVELECQNVSAEKIVKAFMLFVFVIV